MQKIQKPEAINASGFFACHPGSATLWMKDPGLDPGLKRSLTPLLCGFAMTRSCSCFPSHKSRVKS
ncbi:MAG: hypothetical protein M0P37_10280, partial [Synergistaceae bacterium]|nr:hypothetical protein [Synergistaceae bacterium]